MCLYNLYQSIIVFCPRAGLSLQTQHSSLYHLLSLPLLSSYSPFIIMVSYHLISSSARTFFPFTIPCRASFSRQFLLSQWPRLFLFLFFISSSIILPSHTLSITTVFFILSILHASSFSTLTSNMLPVVLAHSVVVYKSLHRSTLHSTQSTSLISAVVLFPRARRKRLFTC